MKYAIRLLFTLAFAVGLSACSSLVSKADKQYQNGAYREAASLYQQALNQDGSNGKAREGLRNARQKMIEQDLIQVRQLRLSDDEQTALDRLRTILSEEADWSLAPSGAAFSTQEEESDELFTWFQKQIGNDLESGQFLKAKLALDKYRSVFEAGGRAHRVTQIEKAIRTKGMSHCAQMQKTATGPFSAEFVRRYCMAWGGGDTLTTTPVKLSSKSALVQYGDIELTGQIENFGPEAMSTLTEDLRNALKVSAYYLPGAAALKVAVEGKFTNQYAEHAIVAVHSYEVDIPYQVEVTVPYTQTYQVPYTTTETYTSLESHYDPVSGSFTQVPVTSTRPVTTYRDETRTAYRQEWETRYRKEPRSLAYPATQYALDMILAAKGDYVLDGVKSSLPLQNELHLSDTYHDTQNLEIGLQAKPRAVPTAQAWLAPELERAGQKMVADLYSVWDSKYCKTPSSLSEGVQIESVMKCLRGTRSNHEFVENWFNARFGLSYATVKEALGVVQ